MPDHTTMAVARAPQSMRELIARGFNYEERSALVFLLPVMVVLAAVTVFPILYSLYLSFFEIKLTRPARTPFVFLDNYIELFSSDLFWTSVIRTTSFTVVSVFCVTLLGLLVALFLNERFRGQRVIAAVLLVPWAIPYVANGLMWQWIYNPDYGALNGLLTQLGLLESYTNWLGDQDKTLFLIANAFIWKEVPLATVLILVTLKAIPGDLYAAAKVDGATVFKRFWHITLPSLRSGFMLVILYETMMAIRHFDLFFLLTQGGPGDTSHVLSWHIFVETFRNLSFGSGAALSYILAIVTFALAYFVIRTLGERT